MAYYVQYKKRDTGDQIHTIKLAATSRRFAVIQAGDKLSKIDGTYDSKLIRGV